MQTTQFTAERGVLTDIELAHYLGVSIATVRKWRLRGKGPKWIKIGSLVRYRREDIGTFLDSRPSGGGAGIAA